MIRVKSIILIATVVALLSCGVPNALGRQYSEGVGLTIYSTADPLRFDPQRFIAQQRQGHNPQYASQVPGFAVVRDIRRLDLQQGTNLVQFTDVAQFIDPTTVTLADLSVLAAHQGKAGIKVLEQKFQFDLVSPTKLLDKYIDKIITVNVNRGDGNVEPVTGTLLSSNQGRLVLQADDGIRVLNEVSDIQLGALPGGLITRPTLQWKLWSAQVGSRAVRTSYQTDGITWRSDYNLVLNRDDTRADMGAWVSIVNMSGTTYKDASLKLIAGDVQRFNRGQQHGYKTHRSRVAMAMEDGASAGFQEKSFFEYHLYTLPQPTTIDQNSTQQISLFPTVRDFKVEKVLVYYGLPQSGQWGFTKPQSDRNLGQQSNKKVDIYIRFDNKEQNKLGMPLPKGKVRVYKLDGPADVHGATAAGGGESLEFVGEDLIDHTAKNEKVLVKIGQAFDVTGERTQVDFKSNYAQHWIEETIRITVKNAKDRPQKVVIRENLYRWVNWKLIDRTHDFEKINSRTIHFEVQVPAEGEQTVQYTVKYNW